MTYARAMNDGSTPRATLVPWRAGVALIGSVLIAGGLLNEDKLIWAAIALAYIGVLLARDERAIDPQHWASESDQRLANVGRIVIAAFLLCALGGVALGLASRWLALAGGAIFLGLLVLSQLADNSAGFIAAARHSPSKALTWTYAGASLILVAIVLTRL
jgi:hypothetical protein